MSERYRGNGRGENVTNKTLQKPEVSGSSLDWKLDFLSELIAVPIITQMRLQ